MKKNIILLCCFIAFIFNACDQEESGPSYKDMNWFVLQDDPHNPLKHLIYQVYESTGIPVFCNDTIGKWEEGIDTLGNPYMQYEILNVNYTLTANNKTASYELEYNEENLMSGVRFLRDTLFPRIPKRIHVHSCLLVKTLVKNDRSAGEIEITAYCGLNTFVVGGMGKLRDMSSQERFAQAMDALSVLVGNYLYSHYALDLEAFYTVSEKADYPGGKPDRYSTYGMWLSYDQSIAEDAWEWMGFLGYNSMHPFMPNSLKAYSKEEDLSSFLAAYFKYTEEEFKARYGKRKYIMEKYGLIKDLVQALY